jgi:excisionase family DNA binding protein
MSKTKRTMTPKPSISLHYTSAEAAAILRVSPETVGDYITRQWLPAVMVGKKWLIKQADIEHLLAHGTPRG